MNQVKSASHFAQHFLSVLGEFKLLFENDVVKDFFRCCTSMIADQIESMISFFSDEVSVKSSIRVVGPF